MKSHFTCCVVLIYFCCYGGVSSQDFEESDVRCVGETGCAACIAAAPNCSWCKDWDFKGPRCDRAEVLQQLGCQEESIFRRGSSAFEVAADNKFSDYVGKDLMRAVQIRPQKAQIKLRPGDAVTLPMKFRPARNYPLDVYYLMDLTWSMSDDKETLANLGDDLASALSNLTRNFKLGFGSFVDKPLMPFVNPSRMDNPCSVERGTCSPAYGFRHHLPLSKDMKMFTDNVRNASVSGNMDNAEGGLDALMQVLACQEQIGWTRDSRKMVIFASDGILHFAGDGKLGGAVGNNDMQCHLDSKTGLYTKSTELDYPSLSQIDKLLLQHKVSMIFAITEDKTWHYKSLSEVLYGATFIATLESDSSNIIQLVRQGYRQFVSSASFSDNATAPIKITYQSTCSVENGQLTDTQSCEKVEEGKEYEFNLTFQIEKCPADPKDWIQNVAIEERGLVTGLQLSVEMLCGCDCENEPSSNQCKGHGDLNCGVCNCHEGWYGPTCSCSERNATSIVELEVGCLPPGAAAEGAEVCWGRGECVCGRCECNDGVTGQFCECANTPCPGGCGPNGQCVCGRCQCTPGWEGRQCDCPSGKDNCIAPGDSKPCSGQGKCQCGRCVCNEVTGGTGRYTGQYCEKCDTCEGLCKLYQTCVHCKVFDEDCPEDEDYNPCITNSSTAYLDIVRELQVSDDLEEELCVFWDRRNCAYKFTYDLRSNRKVRVKVLDSKNCPAPLNAATMVGGIVIAVVLVGLLLLLMWRSAVAAKDRYDYQRFEEALKKANFEGGMNPLYKPATRTYFVPQDFKEPQEPSTPLVTTPKTPLSPLSPKSQFSPRTPLPLNKE